MVGRNAFPLDDRMNTLEYLHQKHFTSVMRMFSRITILATLLAICSSCTQLTPERFLSERAHIQNRTELLKRMPRSLELLRERRLIKIEDYFTKFTYVTDKRFKAQALVESLQAQGHQAKFIPDEKDAGKNYVEGWSQSMLINETTLTDWICNMCNIGYVHDCKLDTWETQLR